MYGRMNEQVEVIPILPFQKGGQKYKTFAFQTGLGELFPAYTRIFVIFRILGLIYLIFTDLQTRVVQNHFALPILTRKNF